MLDMYDFENDIWLCHSFRGQCFNFTAFVINPFPSSIFPVYDVENVRWHFGFVCMILTVVDLWIVLSNQLLTL